MIPAISQHPNIMSRATCLAGTCVPVTTLFDTTAINEQIREWLRQRRLDLHGGAFNYRKKRISATDLSLHSFGIALDWNPLNNPQKKPLKRTFPDWWHDIWQANGWRDGRSFGTPDPMHVQYATGA
jgi:hypothetical protein